MNDYKLIEKEEVVYSNHSNVTVYRNGIGLYLFEINVQKIKVVTCDYIEAISIISKSNINLNDDFWNIKIGEDTKDVTNIQYMNILYWLSGGDSVWMSEETPYKDNWASLHTQFIKKYKRILNNILKKSNAFQEVRKNINSKINLQTIYEFALSSELLK